MGAHFLLSGRVVTATVVVASSSISATRATISVDTEENKSATLPVSLVQSSLPFCSEGRLGESGLHSVQSYKKIFIIL